MNFYISMDFSILFSKGSYSHREMLLTRNLSNDNVSQVAVNTSDDFQSLYHSQPRLDYFDAAGVGGYCSYCIDG